MSGPPGLKLTKRPGSSTWYVRGTVRKQSIFESTGTADAGEAETYRALRQAELYKASVFGTRATVTFARAVESFITTNQPGAGDAQRLKNLLLHFKTTGLDKIDQEAVDRAYGVLLPAGASNANKLRTVLAPLRAVLNHAAKRKWCDVPKFEIPQQKKSRVAYLLPEQAIAQAAACSADFRPLYLFLLFTGARASEALELLRPDVDLWGARCVFRDTKNGRERQVDLCPAAVAVLAVILAIDATPESRNHVFLTGPVRNRRGQVVAPPHPYQNNGRTAGGQFKTAWAGMVKRSGISGFRPHDLRHTWASWDYCLHKDLLGLRNRGGWQSTSQVEIYAHLIPDAYRTQIESMLAGKPVEQQIKKEA